MIDLKEAQKQYGKSLHFVTVVEHQRALLKIATQERQLSMLRAFVQDQTYQTERKENYCPGSHTQYSSMHWAADETCPKCGHTEDGPGGTIVTYEPTATALRALNLLAEIDKLTEQMKGDSCST